MPEEFHGYYHAALDDEVERILGDMLVEAEPRPYTAGEAAGGGWSPPVDTPIRLLNWAWQVRVADPVGYRAWETDQVKRLVRLP